MMSISIYSIFTYIFIIVLSAYYFWQLRKSGKPISNILTTAAKLVYNFLPLLLTVGVYCYVLSQKDIILSQVQYSKRPFGAEVNLQIVYDSYAFMFSSCLLIGTSVLLYLIDTSIKASKRARIKDYVLVLFVLFSVSILIGNIVFCVNLYQTFFNAKNLSTGSDNLRYFEIVSTYSIVSFFIIDLMLIFSIRKNNPIVDMSYLKGLIFSLWNVDMASLLALIFVQFIDNKYLHYSDTYIAYIFVSAGIAIQGVVTQFIFVSYQAKKTLDELYGR